MEIKEFAEKLLFGSKLEDKLFVAGALTDEFPDYGISSFERPGRNRHLTPREDEGFRFPKVHELERNEARAKALHYFANHELLAIEIMAMTLLKFPHAPKAFRRGLVSTIFDEQKHLKLYVDRIRQFGMDFGDLPLNDFFWKNFQDITHPIDFTIRMSLTFEQANLDFSIYYKSLFEKIGDLETAEILQTVYDDEIVHVRHGLHWFDQWRPKEESRWHTFADQLPFPLTPQRAKGQVMVREAREKAGLDEEFIDRLDTFAASKGRVPSLFLFHPDCEEEWISRHYQRPQATQKLFEALSFLPTYSAKSGDAVLVHKKPSTEFLKSLQCAGFETPELIELEEIKRQGQRKFASFEPWGWTPQIGKWLKNQKMNFASPTPESLPSDLFSKAWSVSLLKNYIEENSEDFLCPKEVCGTVCTTEEETLALIQKKQETFPNIVVKAAFGASGRHFLRVNKSPLDQTQKNLLKSFFKKQPAVVVEPWLDKVFDYSLQITAHREKPAIHGQARFLTTATGQYQGALLGGFTTALTPDTKRFLNGDGKDPQRMHRHFTRLADFVSKRANELGYEGPIGIDAMVYRDIDGRFRLRPIVETNCRYNMGRIVVDMEKKLSLPGAGMWRIFHRKELEKAGFPQIQDFIRELERSTEALDRRRFTRTGKFHLQTTPATNDFVSILFWTESYEKLNALLLQLKSSVS